MRVPAPPPAWPPHAPHGSAGYRLQTLRPGGQPPFQPGGSPHIQGSRGRGWEPREGPRAPPGNGAGEPTGGGPSTHLPAGGAGQQDPEAPRELREGVAEREARPADAHGLQGPGVAQLLQAQLAVEELRAEARGG